MRKIKKNKISNYKLIGIIYIIFILTISTAYSFLNENLTINTSASISQNGEDYTIDNIIVSKEEIDGVYYYEYNVILTYTGTNTTTGWETYISIPFDSEITQCYNAVSCTVEGETVTIKNDTTNGNLSPNNTSATFNFKFKTSEPNYIFNTLGVKFFTDNEQNPDDPNPPISDLPIEENISGSLITLYNWGSTRQYLFTINNNSDKTLESWTTTIQFPNGFVVNALWSATWGIDNTTNILTMSGAAWSPTIPSKSSVEINMNVSTPTEENPYIIDFIGTTTTGEQIRIDLSGGAE